jgi:hypothetical protein
MKENSMEVSKWAPVEEIAKHRHVKSGKMGDKNGTWHLDFKVEHEGDSITVGSYKSFYLPDHMSPDLVDPAAERFTNPEDAISFIEREKEKFSKDSKDL